MKTPSLQPIKSPLTMRMVGFIVLFGVFVACMGCTSPPRSLPIIGEQTIAANGDTIYHQIPPFSLINQDSVAFTEASLRGKVYVADFFFAHCPTICPVMAREMLRVQAAFASDPCVHIVSHSVDPKRDTPAVLRAYAERVQINTAQWSLLTGEKDALYELAHRYLSVAEPDSTAPGGFLHTSLFLLIDTQRHIRGVYDGTITEEVDALIADIALLRETEPACEG